MFKENKNEGSQLVTVIDFWGALAIAAESRCLSERTTTALPFLTCLFWVAFLIE